MLIILDPYITLSFSIISTFYYKCSKHFCKPGRRQGRARGKKGGEKGENLCVFSCLSNIGKQLKNKAKSLQGRCFYGDHGTGQRFMTKVQGWRLFILMWLKWESSSKCKCPGAIESRAWPQVSCGDDTTRISIQRRCVLVGDLGHALIPLVTTVFQNFSCLFFESTSYPIF